MILTDKNRSILSTLTTSPFDANAITFIRAASITSTTEITAIDNLVKDLKRNDLWDKMQAIYPIVGGTENSHKYNLKDPRDADAAFRLSFTTGWTHNASGATPNGTSAYADTFYNSVSSATQNSHHISYYSRTDSTGIEIEIGNCEGANGTAGATRSFIEIRTVTISYFGNNTIGNDGTFNFTDTNSRGFYLSNRTASNVSNAWKNGAKSATTTLASKTPPNRKYFLGAYNNNNTPANFSTKQCAFASIGGGLTDSEATTFNTIVEAYQTTLGRQVVASTTINRPLPLPSNIPIRTFGPRELYGSSLITHFDATDYKNYSLSTLTYVPIPQTGSTQIAAAFDTSFTRRRYNTTLSVINTGNITEANNTWVSYPPSFTNFFTGSSFDTNKGSLGNNSQFGTTYIRLYTPYSGNNNLAPNSAVTLGFYSFLNANNLNHPGFGPQRFQNAIGKILVDEVKTSPVVVI